MWDILQEQGVGAMVKGLWDQINKWLADAKAKKQQAEEASRLSETVDG